jgi:hypothetical protein
VRSRLEIKRGKELRPSPRTLYSLLINANRPEYFTAATARSYPARADEITAVFDVPQVDQFGEIPRRRK